MCLKYLNGRQSEYCQIRNKTKLNVREFLIELQTTPVTIIERTFPITFRLRNGNANSTSNAFSPQEGIPISTQFLSTSLEYRMNCNFRLWKIPHKLVHTRTVYFRYIRKDHGQIKILWNLITLTWISGFHRKIEAFQSSFCVFTFHKNRNSRMIYEYCQKRDSLKNALWQ